MTIKVIGSTTVPNASIDVSDFAKETDVLNFMNESASVADTLEDQEDQDSGMREEASLETALLDDASDNLYTLAVSYSRIIPQPTPAQVQALAVALDLPPDVVVSMLESADEVESDIAETASVLDEDVVTDVDLDEDDDDATDNELDDALDALDDVDLDTPDTPDEFDDTLSDQELEEIDKLLDEPNLDVTADAEEHDTTSDETDDLKTALNNDGQNTTRPAADDVAIMHDGELVKEKDEQSPPLGYNDGEPTTPAA